MRIKKISGTAVLQGNIVDSLNSNSSLNAPSIRAVNEAIGQIIESGDGYIKYSDGTMICYGSTSGSSTNTDYWGQFERTDDKLSVDFPQNFISTPIVCATPNYEGSTVSIMTSTITVSSFKFIILRIKGTTPTNYGLKYIAIGKWKSDVQTASEEPSSDESIVSDETIFEEPTI